ncbi:hypothetical protein ScPMuIL_010613 [Solemya velum]
METNEVPLSVSLHLSSDSPAPRRSSRGRKSGPSLLGLCSDPCQKMKHQLVNASLFYLDLKMIVDRDAESLGTGQDSDMPDVTLSFDSHGIHSHGELHSHYSDRPDSSSVFSETFHSHPYRSRIPVPVAGLSWQSHDEEKILFNREDSGIYPPGKRLRRGEGLTSSCLRGQHGRPHSLAAVQRSRIPSKENHPQNLLNGSILSRAGVMQNG